jgi:hypothetical protein
MQQVREITLSSESSKLAVRSEGRLSDVESEALTVLLDQIAAHYPHQAFGDETGEIWREAFEMLAAKYGLVRLREVLVEFLIKPGQKFFPHPGEAAEDLEALMAKERKATAEANPRPACSKCDGQGWQIKQRENGSTYAERCECWHKWKQGFQSAGPAEGAA